MTTCSDHLFERGGTVSGIPLKRCVRCGHTASMTEKERLALPEAGTYPRPAPEVWVSKGYKNTRSRDE